MTYTFDSRAVRPGMGFVALKGEKADGHAFIPMALANGAAEIVDGLEALQAKALAYRRTLKAKVIGVTGSAGKTTTKELLKAFLSRIGRTSATEGNFNNHIGLPLTILNCPADADFLVVEMGTNHPGEIAALCAIAEPDAGLITNVGTAHLEFFGTQDGIAAEKGVLGATARDFFVIGANNVRLDALKRMCRGEAVVADTSPAWLASALEGVLPGAHNVSNAAIAFAAAERYGVTREQAGAALADFRLPGARWKRSERNGVTVIDDSYNANPDSMVAALEAFAKTPCAGRRVVVLGDMFELGARSEEFHRQVFDRVRALGFDLVVGVGETSSRMAPDRAYPDVDALAAEWASVVRPGDCVFLKGSHGMRLSTLAE